MATTKNRSRDWIQERLAQIQSRYSGKDPFGPLDDLDALLRELPEENGRLLVDELRRRNADPFWSAYVAQFLSRNR